MYNQHHCHLNTDGKQMLVVQTLFPLSYVKPTVVNNCGELLTKSMSVWWNILSTTQLIWSEHTQDNIYILKYKDCFTTYFKYVSQSIQNLHRLCTERSYNVCFFLYVIYIVYNIAYRLTCGHYANDVRVSYFQHIGSAIGYKNLSEPPLP